MQLTKCSPVGGYHQSFSAESHYTFRPKVNFQAERSKAVDDKFRFLELEKEKTRKCFLDATVITRGQSWEMKKLSIFREELRLPHFMDNLHYCDPEYAEKFGLKVDGSTSDGKLAEKEKDFLTSLFSLDIFSAKILICEPLMLTL
uniref:Uncharacterized protein n=1 Tax=Romanomermis culicivorax TaxID=13658 RepID=A0A915JMS6_ROMCU